VSYPGTARNHLNWAVERALVYFDLGDQSNAIASFASDCNKHDGTRWIVGHPMTLPMLMVGFDEGREAFKKTMAGFAVSDD
jgi:hypothetical protein